MHKAMNIKAKIIIIALCLIIGIIVLRFVVQKRPIPSPTSETNDIKVFSSQNQESTGILHPMAIEALRGKEYSGGAFEIEQALPNGSNYQQFIASYKSEGLKIYGLLTVPLATRPQSGYPAIVFVHGYIPPDQYSTTGNYPTYQAALARGGFVTFKPDLRGHGNSEGEPVQAHYSEKYTVDTLNALAYLKQYQEVDPNRIGYWGHSNGGEIGLRTILVDTDIKAASFWAGVVGSYQDMFETYISDIPFLRDDENPLTKEYGLPSNRSSFWKSVEPYEFIGDIDIPIQLQHGTADRSVPVELSLALKEALEVADKDVTYIEYSGDDHNIAQNSGVAWQRTIAFFRENL